MLSSFSLNYHPQASTSIHSGSSWDTPLIIEAISVMISLPAKLLCVDMWCFMNIPSHLLPFTLNSPQLMIFWITLSSWNYPLLWPKLLLAVSPYSRPQTILPVGQGILPSPVLALLGLLPSLASLLKPPHISLVDPAQSVPLSPLRLDRPSFGLAYLKHALSSS